MATQLNASPNVVTTNISAKVATTGSESHTRIWSVIAPVTVTVILALLPPPAGLAHFAWLYFSIFAGVIVGLIFEPLPGAAIALIGLTLVTVLARFALFSPQQLSASGFRPASAALTWALSG